MLFIAYNISGLRYFLFLSIPVLLFIAMYVFYRARYGKKIEDSRVFYIASFVMTAYVFIFFAFLFLALRAHAQEDAAEQALIIREAQEAGESYVAVEGRLVDGIFEVIVTARMANTRPKIYNVIVVGPGLGRLSCESKQALLATAAEEKPFLTKKKDKAFINLTKEEEFKVGKGTLTRESFTFRIPRDRILKEKKYELWVQIESMLEGGRYRTFKFALENFALLCQ